MRSLLQLALNANMGGMKSLMVAPLAQKFVALKNAEKKIFMHVDADISGKEQSQILTAEQIVLLPTVIRG